MRSSSKGSKRVISKIGSCKISIPRIWYFSAGSLVEAERRIRQLRDNASGLKCKDQQTSSGRASDWLLGSFSSCKRLIRTGIPKRRDVLKARGFYKRLAREGAT